MTPEAVLAAAIMRTVDQHRTRRVPLSVVMVAAAAVDHTAAASVGWRNRIATAIDGLVDTGHIAVPKSRIGNPPLPQYVIRPPEPKPHAAVDPAPVWHAELAWAANLIDAGQLNTADQSFLVAINAWLSRRRGIAVPTRERSLEIFGDEKLLENKVSGPLFAPGRLTLELLEAYPCWPYVEQLDCGPGDWIVIENYTTYHSVGQRAREVGFDGRIISGSGNQVATRLAALAAEPARPPRLFYFGDIDAGGFRIAMSAAAKAELHNLPALTPARGLYRLAHMRGTARADKSSRLNPVACEWAAAWLGGDLAAQTMEVLASHRRIVQEFVGKEALMGTTVDEWLH